MDYYKLIAKRRSNRDFEEESVNKAVLDELIGYFPEAMRLFPSIQTKIVLAEPDVQSLCGATGYANVLVRAPHYLLVLSAPDEGYLENAGFIVSDMALKLTDMGVDHCWLTVTDSEAVKTAFGVRSDMRAAALVAFGKGRRRKKSFRLDIENETKVDVIRREEHVAPKVPPNELVFHEAWGEPEYVTDIDDQIDLKYAFLAASMAPSYLNLQPYRLIWDVDKVILVLKEDKRTTPKDAHLNAGIVMQHISAVLSQYRPKAPEWQLGAPEGKDYGLPEGCEIAAWCRA